MGTAFSEIISDYGMLYIDDSRLQDSASISPAQFYRRMSLYMNSAIPMFNRPPTMTSYLTNQIIIPTYDETSWVSTEESLTQETVIDTGFLEYELFSCVVVYRDSADNITMYKYDEATYDPITGTVTFPIQTEVGVTYSLDFYNDGIFFHELTYEQKRILGLCIGATWDERFSRNWEGMTPKIKDKSFSTLSEDKFMKSSTAMKKENRILLNEELRQYENNQAYLGTNY